jgi:hypothetical protein
VLKELGRVGLSDLRACSRRPRPLHELVPEDVAVIASVEVAIKNGP